MKKTLHLLTKAALPVLIATALACPSDAFAQSRNQRIHEGFDVMPDGITPTNGTISTQTSSNWTTAPWMTTGPKPYPDDGGVATLNEQVNTILGTPPAVPTLTLDIPITLSGITYNSVYQYIIAGTATNNLTLTGAATLNVVRSNASSLSTFAAGHVISAPIAGSVGLTKIGSGILTLSGTNTYTGGTRINGGVLRLTTGDAALGATGVGNDVQINDATMRVSTTALTTARNFAITGNARIEMFAAATINGVISGSGNLVRSVGGTLALTLTNTNTYTGSTVQDAGILTLSGGNGSIATSSGYDITGTMNLDSSAGNNNNRISDTAAITSRGATFTLTGNSTAATAETAGAMTLASGITTITVTPNAAQPASLSFASMNRQNGSALFVRGTNLGATPGAGVAQINSGTAPGPLVGGGGAAGSTNISILPFAAGNLSATATVGSTHVTYSAGSLRPLATTEYATDFTGSATNNVRITAATTAPSGATANALLFAPAAAATLDGGPINVTSGSFIYSPTVASTGTVNAGLNFAAAEGNIINTSALNIGGVITGTNGVTFSAIGGTVTLTGANTYTGPTQVNQGQLTFNGTIDPTTPGPLGQSSSPIILNVGSATTRIWVNGTTTFNRDFIIQGNPSNFVIGGLGSTTTNTITVNGNINMQRRLAIENGSSLPFTINGVVSGPGSLTDSFSSLVVLNGANTYTGGTEVNTGTYELGNNSGFGTGTVFINNTGTIRGGGTGTRTIGNNFLYLANNTFSGSVPLNLTGTIDLNGGNRTITVTNTAPTTFSGDITNGALIKAGAGEMVLNRAAGNSYTGGTIVNAGTLTLNNTSGSATGSGTVNVLSAGTLAGSFSVSGFAQMAGTLNVGGVNATGASNFGSDFSLTSTAVSNFELTSASAFDRLNVGQLLTLAGTINVTTINGFVAQVGMSFDLLNWGTLNASNFNIANLNLSGAAVAPGAFFDTSTFLQNGTITVVPEPSTYALLVTGFVMAAGAARRKMRSRRNDA